MTMRALALLGALLTMTMAAPTPDGQDSNTVGDQLVSFDKFGNVGVNFGGFRASAGLGLDGKGLHASAGTPSGQAAAAGLGGRIGDDAAAGGLYAGATAGGGISASAGLAGSTGSEGSAGFGGASASTGSLTKTVQLAPAGHFEKEISVGVAPEVGPVVALPPPPPPVYVHKTVYRKRPHRVHKYATRYTEFVPVAEVAPEPVIVHQQTYVKPVPAAAVHKEVVYSAPAVGVETAVAVKPVVVPVAPATTYTKRVTAVDTGKLFENIFAIPISTLSAVRDLLTGTSASISKEVTVKH